MCWRAIKQKSNKTKNKSTKCAKIITSNSVKFWKYLSRLMTKSTKCIRPVWSGSSLSTWIKKLGSLATFWAHSWRLWWDKADAQADLSLRWAHNHFVGFVGSEFFRMHHYCHIQLWLKFNDIKISCRQSMSKWKINSITLVSKLEPKVHPIYEICSFGPRQANLVLIAYASSEGSGEPAHLRSLARTSAARSYKQWVKRNL